MCIYEKYPKMLGGIFGVINKNGKVLTMTDKNM